MKLVSTVMQQKVLQVEGNVFKAEVEEAIDFDPSKLTIYYHEDDEGVCYASEIIYEDFDVSNDWGGGTVWGSFYSLFANEADETNKTSPSQTLCNCNLD